MLAYIKRYALLDEAAARRNLASLQRPFHETYIFTYYYGCQLVEAYLEGPQRQTRLYQLLTRQLTPSDLLDRDPER